MKLISYDKYLKMSKPALIRKITKALRAMPKAKLARLCYNITKSKLPRLKTHKSSKRKGKYQYQLGHSFVDYDPRYTKLGRRTSYGMQSQVHGKDKPRRKTKRKFSAKQLAAQRLFAKRARAGTLRKRRRR